MIFLCQGYSLIYSLSFEKHNSDDLSCLWVNSNSKGSICQNDSIKQTFANEDIVTVACASLHLPSACQKQQLLFEAVICKIASIVCFLSLHKYDEHNTEGQTGQTIMY